MGRKMATNWIMDGHCAYRLKEYGCEDIPKNRIAFIEKTPRVRVPYYTYGVEEKNNGACVGQNTDAWIYGSNGDCDYGNNMAARKWCDDMLKLLGYEILDSEDENKKVICGVCGKVTPLSEIGRDYECDLCGVGAEHLEVF